MTTALGVYVCTYMSVHGQAICALDKDLVNFFHLYNKREDKMVKTEVDSGKLSCSKWY